MSTFLQLQTNVLAHGFSSSQYLTYIKEKLNEGQEEAARRLDLRGFYTEQSITLVAGTDSYNLVTTAGLEFLRADYLYDPTDDETLEFILGGGEAWENLSAASGEPTHWMILEGAIRVYPNPNSAGTLKLRYWRRPTTMVGDANVPEIPAPLHHLLESYAVARCFRREGDRAMHDSFMADFNADLQRAGNQYDVDDEPTSPGEQIAGAW